MQPQLQSAAFNAAIFRRGLKAEAFGTDPEGDDATELAGKLQILLETWESIRIGKDIIGTIWRPKLRCAEATVVKGKVLAQMGFLQGNKTYLHVEEVLYLLDRANILQFCDFAKAGKRMMSIQEAQEMLAVGGMNVEQYICYCKLVRAGYIVQRFPCRWALRQGEDSLKVWQAWDEAAGPALATREQHACSSTASGETKPHVQEPGQWWESQDKWMKAQDGLLEEISCSVEELTYRNLRCLPRLKSVKLGKSLGCRPRHLDLTVYPAGSLFSRKVPAEPGFNLHVCTGSETLVSLLPVLSAGETSSGGITVHHGTVEKGDVAMYGIPHVVLKKVLH